MHIHRAAKSWSCPRCMFPAEVEQSNALTSCFSFHIDNKCSLFGLFSTTFFSFLCFFLVLSLFEMVSRFSVDMLSSVPKYKAVMSLMRKCMY